MQTQSVDLSTKPKSFASYLMKFIKEIHKKTPDEIIKLIENAKEEGVHVSQDYLDKVLTRAEELRTNKPRLLKYFADIILKGSDLGVIDLKTSIDEMMEKIGSLYSSKDELLVDLVIKKRADLLSNVEHTWKASKNFESFADTIQTFVNSYLSRNTSPIERRKLREAISKGTGGVALLVHKDNQWKIIPTLTVKSV